MQTGGGNIDFGNQSHSVRKTLRRKYDPIKMNYKNLLGKAWAPDLQPRHTRYKADTNPLEIDASQPAIEPTPARKIELLKKYYKERIQDLAVVYKGKYTDNGYKGHISDTGDLSIVGSSPAFQKWMKKQWEKTHPPTQPYDPRFYKQQAAAPYIGRFIKTSQAKLEAYSQIIAQLNGAGGAEAVLDAYLRGFHSFLRGRPTDEHKKKMKALGFKEEFEPFRQESVQQYLRAFSRVKKDYYEDLAMLRMQGPTGDLHQIELFYKYILDAKEDEKIERNLWDWLEGGKLSKYSGRLLSGDHSSLVDDLYREFPVGTEAPKPPRLPIIPLPPPAPRGDGGNDRGGGGGGAPPPRPPPPADDDEDQDTDAARARQRAAFNAQITAYRAARQQRNLPTSSSSSSSGSAPRDDEEDPMEIPLEEVPDMDGVPSDPTGQLTEEAGSRAGLLQDMIADFDAGDIDEGQAQTFQATIDMTRRYVNNDLDHFYAGKVEPDHLQDVKDALNATLDQADAARNKYIASAPSAPPALAMEDVAEMDFSEDEDDDAPSNTFTVPSQTAAGVPDETKVPPTPAAAAAVEPEKPDSVPTSPETPTADSTSPRSSPAEPSEKPSTAEEKSEKTTEKSSTTTESPPAERKSEESPAASRATEEEELEKELEEDFEPKPSEEQKKELEKPAPVRQIVDTAAAQPTPVINNITISPIFHGNQAVSRSEGSSAVQRFHSDLGTPQVGQRTAAMVAASPYDPDAAGYNAYAQSAAVTTALERQIENYKSKYERSQERIRSLEAESREQEERIDAASTHYLDLQDEKRRSEDLDKKLKAADERLAAERATVTQLKADMHAKESDMAAEKRTVERELDDFRNATTEKERATQLKHEEALAKERDRAEQRIKENNDQNRDLKRRFEHAQKELEAVPLLKQENESLKEAARTIYDDAKRQALEYYREKHETELTKAKDDALHEFNEKESELSSKYLKLQAAHSDLKSKLDTSDAAHRRVVDQLDQQLRDARQKLADEIKANTNAVYNKGLEVEKRVRAEEQARVSQQLTDAASNVKLMQSKIEQLNTEILGLRLGSTKDATTISTMNERIAQLVSQHSIDVQNYEQAKKDLETATSEYQRLEEAASNATAPLNERIKTLEAEAKEAESAKRSAAAAAVARLGEKEKEVQKQVTATEAIQKQLNEAQAKQAELQAQLATLQAEKTKAEEAASKKGRLLRSTKRQLEDANKTKQEISSKFDEVVAQQQREVERAAARTQAVSSALQSEVQRSTQLKSELQATQTAATTAMAEVRSAKRKADEIAKTASKLDKMPPAERKRAETRSSFLDAVAESPMKIARLVQRMVGGGTEDVMPEGGPIITELPNSREQISSTLNFAPVAPEPATSSGAPSNTLSSALSSVMASEEPAPRRQRSQQNQISDFHQKVIEQARNMPEPVRQGVSATGGGSGSMPNDDDSSGGRGVYREFGEPAGEAADVPLPTEAVVAGSQQLQDDLRTLNRHLTDNNVRYPTVREKGRDVPVPESETEMQARLLRDQLQSQVRDNEEVPVREMGEKNKKREREPEPVEAPVNTSAVDVEPATEEEEPYQYAFKFDKEKKALKVDVERSADANAFRNRMYTVPQTLDNHGFTREEAEHLKANGFTAKDVMDAYWLRADMQMVRNRAGTSDRRRQRLDQAINSLNRKLPDLDNIVERWQQALHKRDARDEADREQKRRR
jgi:hypothetical protein